MANKSNASVTEVYTLPSKGTIYGIGPDVTIRSMTTKEEKMRLGNQGFYTTMCSILDSVVISPDNFNSRLMTQFDFYFLMYKMRVVSYGPSYKVTVNCPKCGKSDVYTVNLDDLKVNYLPDDFVEPFKIGPLPRSGDTLECRLLRITDSIENDRKATEILKNDPDYVGDPTPILNMVSQIVKINGDSKLPAEVTNYVENMLALDSAYYEQAYNKIISGIGMSSSCEDECKHCGHHLRFGLPFNSEFFRPTFDL